VPLKERGEGSFIPASEELLEQLAVAWGIPAYRTDEVADLPQNACQGWAGHLSSPMCLEDP
jgi:hypothetical protein